MNSLQRNAIIMSAGMSSRFVPLSAEIPKGLLEVKGEILIERQIKQLMTAGIDDITIVVGYMADSFGYLRDKYGVDIVLNEDYYRFNNTSSLVRVLDRLKHTYICSSDNYFTDNLFQERSIDSYYSALYSKGPTGEYCMEFDNEDNISGVSIGGKDAWYMIGHAYFSEMFSRKFSEILSEEYQYEDTRHAYWEDVYRRHIKDLPPLKIHRYRCGEINEFDSIDELRAFDQSYITDTRSSIVRYLSKMLDCCESALTSFNNIPHEGDHLLFSFRKDDIYYIFNGKDRQISTL